jgi:uncharacterized protein (DUF433 family)
MKLNVSDLLAINDPREVPAYSIKIAAHYLRMPAATLRDWVRGRKYPVHDGTSFSPPLIQLRNENVPLLSFYNLAEAHVLGALRRDFEIPMPVVKSALDYVTNKFGWKRPLIQQEFKVHGAKLFVEHMSGELVEASNNEQRVLHCVKEHMRRIEWENKLAARLYPFTRNRISDTPKMVLIDPRFSFGLPFLAKTRVQTAIIAERYKAGDAVRHLARDYECATEEIEEAIRCELDVAVAA